MHLPTGPLRAIPAPLADAGLAALLVAVDAASLLSEFSACCGEQLPAALWLSLGFGIPLAVRRRGPTAVWLVVGLTAVVWDLLALPPTLGAQFALMIALYTVAAHAPAGHVSAVAVLTLVGIVVTVWWTDGLVEGLPETVLTATLFAAPLFLGDGVRSRRAALVDLQDRAVRLEREREALARLAVIEERGRIARDLHDVVAHHLSVMVIQAEAAASVVEGRPDQARDRLEALATTGRDALVEMRRVLGVLRQPEGHDRAPQPDLDALAALVEQARDDGLAVHLQRQGGAVPVPASTAVSVHRIVQEALTNARRHAGAGARVVVTLVWEPDALVVRVRDDGVGVVGGAVAGGAVAGGAVAGGAVVGGAVAGGAGLGLLGMRERAAIAGGVLHHGPHPDGGFEVLARLPITDVADEADGARPGHLAADAVP